jgi:hypothetical protein
MDCVESKTNLEQDNFGEEEKKNWQGNKINFATLEK